MAIFEFFEKSQIFYNFRFLVTFWIFWISLRLFLDSILKYIMLLQHFWVNITVPITFVILCFFQPNSNSGRCKATFLICWHSDIILHCQSFQVWNVNSQLIIKLFELLCFQVLNYIFHLSSLLTLWYFMLYQFRYKSDFRSVLEK